MNHFIYSKVLIRAANENEFLSNPLARVVEWPKSKFFGDCKPDFNPENFFSLEIRLLLFLPDAEFGFRDSDKMVIFLGGSAKSLALAFFEGISLLCAL